MLYLVIFLLCLLIVLALVLILANGYILFEYNREKNKDNFVISIFTFHQLLKYKYEVPLIDLKKNGLKSILLREKDKKEKDVNKEEKLLDIAEILRRFKFFKKSDSIDRALLKYLWNKSKLREVRLDIFFGTGDAALTGLVNAFIWSAVGILDSYITKKFIDYKRHYNIQANFNKKEVEIDFYCIFGIKLVHIIIAWLRYRYNHYKGKSKSKRSIGGDFSG